MSRAAQLPWIRLVRGVTESTTRLWLLEDHITWRHTHAVLSLVSLLTPIVAAIWFHQNRAMILFHSLDHFGTGSSSSIRSFRSVPDTGLGGSITQWSLDSIDSITAPLPASLAPSLKPSNYFSANAFSLNRLTDLCDERHQIHVVGFDTVLTLSNAHSTNLLMMIDGDLTTCMCHLMVFLLMPSLGTSTTFQNISFIILVEAQKVIFKLNESNLTFEM